MPKKTIDDLKRIREKTARDISLRYGIAKINITVHMGACGIEAGAREVMKALMEEIAGVDRADIRALASKCPGACENEPMVTVEIEGEPPTVYRHMNAEKMRAVFQRHVLGGEVQADFTLESA